MSATPRLSFIVPVYNAAEHLPALLAALRSQTLAAVEFIFVDDGSTDASPALLREFAAAEPRARVMRQANGGPSRARNAAIAKARGDYVAFADADDWVDPALAEAVVAALDGDRLDVVCFNGQRIDSHGVLDAQPLYRHAKPSQAVDGRRWIAAAVAQGDFLQYLWLMACRRSLAQGTRFEPDIVHEDIVWTCQVLVQARRVGFLDRPLYRYRSTPDSLMREPSDASAMRRIEGYMAVVGHLLVIAEQAGEARAALRRHAAVEAGHVFRLARKLRNGLLRRSVYARARRAGLARLLWRQAKGLAERRRAVRAMALTAFARDPNDSLENRA